MRALSYVIQAVIERDSANRSRTENILSEKNKRNILCTSMLHERNMRRGGVGWNCIQNEI